MQNFPVSTELDAFLGLQNVFAKLTHDNVSSFPPGYSYYVVNCGLLHSAQLIICVSFQTEMPLISFTTYYPR